MVDSLKLGRMLEQCVKEYVPYTDHQTEEHLRMIYGQKIDFEIGYSHERPISPRSTLLNAEEYITKQMEKGNTNAHHRSFNVNDIYRGVVEKGGGSLNPKQEHSKTYEEVKNLDFWLSTRTVVNSVQEIRNLPYKFSEMAITSETRFMDKVRLHIWKLTSHSNIELSQLPPNQAQELMMKFVKGVAELRKRKISNLIAKGMIDTSRLSSRLKKEFIVVNTTKSEERPSFVRNAESEQKTFEDIARNISNMPEAYRFNNFCLDDRSRSQFTMATQESLQKLISDVPTLMRSASSDNAIGHAVAKAQISTTRPRITRPQLKSSKSCSSRIVSNKKLVDFYWKESDPLQNYRSSSHPQTLGSFTTICEGLQTPEVSSRLAEVDFKPAQLTQQQSTMLFKTVPDVIGEAAEEEEDDYEEPLKPHSSPEESPSEDKRPIDYSLYVKKTEKSRDIAFLVKKNAEILYDDNQTSYNELDAIWSNLGFTIQQRLRMAAKYTQDIDASSRLSDALILWKRACESANHYHQVYDQVKFFLRSAEFNKLDEKLLEDYEKALQSAENTLFDIHEKLRIEFGDEFIIRRRRATDVIATRRQKLKSIKLSITQI